MRSIVLDSLKSQRLCKVASNLWSTTYDRSLSSLIDKVDYYLRGIFMYVPEEIETVQTPDWMLQGKEINGFVYGDCDDIATLEAAILTCMGIKCRFVCIRSKPDISYYDHVYIEALGNNGEWVVSDITVPKDTKHVWYQRLEIAI